MRSKIEIELKANGTLLDITQGEDKIFQGAVGVTEYHLSVASGITGDYNWRPTDIVYMSLKRNDGQTAQVKMTAENGGWVWTSNGWETDVDISGTGNLELSFIGKRYSTVSVGTVAFEKTTEKIDLIVYESAGYVPQNIDIEIAEELQEAINVLQLDKVGRYSVSEENLPYLPAEIVYDLDGAKTPNNVYFDFTNNVVDYDGETREKVGAILVISNDGVQTELFLTSDGKMYSRTIDGGVTDFVSTAKVDFQFYTYNKVEIDQKDADTLQNAKDYADDNFYNETDADNRFVHLSGNETIADTKTFSASPIVPNPTANTHAVNRESMQVYAYSKDEVNRITQGISFDTKANFELWLVGGYVRPDGIFPSDMIIGKKVYILEAVQPNYRCISLPAVSLANFEVLAEDVKALQETTATPFDDITAENGQSCVEQINDKVNLKSQITEEADLTILTTDWVDNTTNYYYDYFNANFTNPTKQRFEFISNDLTQNTTLSNEQFVTLKLENITSGSNYGIRIYVNKMPSIDITFKVLLETYTNSNVPVGDITASNITYDNTTSGLIATNVKTAIDELASEKIDKIVDNMSLFPLNTLYGYVNVDNEPYKVEVASQATYSPSGTNIKMAVFDEYGNLGTSAIPTEITDYTNKQYVDTAPKNYIDFTTEAVTLQERRMRWTETYGTLEAQLKNGIVLQIGQEFYFYGKATETITNGQVVAIAGSVGGNLLFKVADQSDIDYSADLICGVATQDIANNSFGYVTRVGRVGTLNTYAWTEGTIIYFDGSGGLTSTRPTNGHPIVQIGVVEAQASSPSSNNGRIVVDLKINRITQSVVGQSEVLAPSAKAVYDYVNGEILYSGSGLQSIDLSTSTFKVGDILQIDIDTYQNDLTIFLEVKNIPTVGQIYGSNALHGVERFLFTPTKIEYYYFNVVLDYSKLLSFKDGLYNTGVPYYFIYDLTSQTITDSLGSTILIRKVIHYKRGA